MARLEGKSSLGRLGLLIHSTAGFVDPSFEGNLTLELSNVANLPITIYHGMPIGQISFMRMDGPVEHPYGAARGGKQVPGPGGAHPVALLPQLRERSSSRGRRRLACQGRSGYHVSPMPNIGPLEIVLVLIIALIVFGPKRLPELGRSMGRGIREFKNSVTGDKDDDDERPRSSCAEPDAPATPRSSARGRGRPRPQSLDRPPQSASRGSAWPGSSR